MFNFLRSRAASMQKVRIATTRVNAQRTMRVCSFCNFQHLKAPKLTRYPCLRNYATTDILQLHAPLKRKIKYRTKKYVELLEVTDEMTSNKKAPIRKLNSDHVSILVDQPDITLDKLHKIDVSRAKKIANTTTVEYLKAQLHKNTIHDHKMHHDVLKEVSSEYLEDKTVVVEELKESGVSDHAVLIKDSSFLESLQETGCTDNSKDLANTQSHDDQDNNISIPFMKEADKFGHYISDQNLISQLLAYMDVYIQSGMTHKALKMLMSNRNKLKSSKISTIALYNLLLETFVSENHISKVFNIYKLIDADSVNPNSETYALMFEMIGKMKNNAKQAEKAAEIVADMNRKGLSLNNVMNIARMNTHQQAVVLNCIRLVDPNYKVQYKGINVKYDCKLLQNMAMENNYKTPVETVITPDELRNMVHTQVDMEKQFEINVESIAPFLGDPRVKQEATQRIAEWEKSWELSMTNAFEEKLNYLKEKEIRMQADLKALHPFLEVLPKEEYVYALLREIKQLANSSDAYSVSISNLYISLGKYIYKKYELQRKKKAGTMKGIIQVYDKYLDWYLQMDSTERNLNGRIKWQQLVYEANKAGLCSDMIIPEWPHNVLLNVGKFLYNIIINNTKISHLSKLGTVERDIPAFYLLFRNKTKFLTEEIKPHPQLHKVFKDSSPEMLTFETILLPTCAPPRPWVGINTGGFLFSKAEFVRAPYVGMTPADLLKNSPQNKLYPAFDCLNQLGSIPWKINKPVLDILIQIFRNGGSESLNVPESPSSLPSLAELLSTEAVQDKSKKARMALQLRRKKGEMYSLWCDCLYKLSLANYFRDKVFWLPHNLDFRGRAYPIPPHLNHLSSDLGRSILIFAQGKPLGPNGLDWLKLHAINLTGIKKREPIHKRIEFANEMLDSIIDSARKPLTGEMWWTKSDEPWQTLAACMEIDKAIQSPNVEEYICRFPIHQDGSCNGLQHYAALGRDQIGAESVNLYPSSTPQDVYSVVAAMVDEYRQNDANNGNEIAKALEGYISRKVIKQTVMTTVYGVTKFGARLQIARQLSDLKEFPQNYTWSGSLYLVEMTFKSLRTMFTSAKEIQDWFTDCARVISTRCNQYVQWVTPLGLPVLQPYCKRHKTGSRNLKKPDTLKQKNAFPPNFIHSLDSSHMMLTSLHCERAGITFMSVHDCFWTHPCSVEIMNKICREQFVSLHAEPILEDLSNYLAKRYQSYFMSERILKKRDEDLSIEVFMNLPKKGNFDINMVQSSRYFFS